MPDVKSQTADTPKWDQLTDDVNVRIAALKACWTATAADKPDLHKRLARDLYLPALRLLAEFCSAVEIEEEHVGD